MKKANKTTTVLESLPKGWQRIKLGDIYGISAGGDLNPQEFSLVEDKHHLYPIYSNALTNKGLYGYSTYAKHDLNAITITGRGDIGIANHRTTKFVAIGRLLVLKNKIPILNKFVSEYINYKIRFLKETTGVPQLTVPQVSMYYITLPPLSEQKRIVKVLSTWDQAIETLEKLILAKQKQFKWLSNKSLSQEGWPMISLGYLLSLEYGKPLKRFNRKGEQYPVFGSNGIDGCHNEYLIKGPLIVVGRKGSAGKVNYYEQSGFPIDTTFYVKLKKLKSVHLKYLFFQLKQINLKSLSSQSTVPGINRNHVYLMKIPLPSLEQQKRITEILSKYEEEIKTLKQLCDKYHIQKKGLMQKLLTGKIRLQ